MCSIAGRITGQPANFVSGLLANGVPVSAGGSVAAGAGVRLAKALGTLAKAGLKIGKVVRPDIVIESATGSSVFDAKFRWKKGMDKLSPNQAAKYKRIDQNGKVGVVNGEKCGCP